MKRRGEQQFPPPSGTPQSITPPAAMTGQLFDTAQYTKPEPQMDYDPETWLGRPDISWHASDSHRMPDELNEPGYTQVTGYGQGFHHGSLGSAMQRGRISAYSHINSEDFHSYMNRGFIHPVRMTGEIGLRHKPMEVEHSKLNPSENQMEQWGEHAPKERNYYQTMAKHKMTFGDFEANVDLEAPPTGPLRSAVAREAKTAQAAASEHFHAGRHIPYVNAAEDVGSVSFRSPRESISTWAEDVQSDPGASRHHQLLAEQFDLTIPVGENWQERLGRSTRPNAKSLPGSLSGEAHEQGTLFTGVKESHLYPARTVATSRLPPKVQPAPGSGWEPSGKSNLPLMQPRMVRGDRELD